MHRRMREYEGEMKEKQVERFGKKGEWKREKEGGMGDVKQSNRRQKMPHYTYSYQSLSVVM